MNTPECVQSFVHDIHHYKLSLHYDRLKAWAVEKWVDINQPRLPEAGAAAEPNSLQDDIASAITEAVSILLRGLEVDGGLSGTRSVERVTSTRWYYGGQNENRSIGLFIIWNCINLRTLTNRKYLRSSMCVEMATAVIVAASCRCDCSHLCFHPA